MSTSDSNAENMQLKRRIQELQDELSRYRESGKRQKSAADTKSPLHVESLSNEHIKRYSRQLLVPSFGVQGQLKLLSTSILVVGCGGLGSIVMYTVTYTMGSQ